MTDVGLTILEFKFVIYWGWRAFCFIRYSFFIKNRDKQDVGSIRFVFKSDTDIVIGHSENLIWVEHHIV